MTKGTVEDQLKEVNETLDKIALILGMMDLSLAHIANSELMSHTT